MKLKLNNSKLFFNKPVQALTEKSTQINAFASGQTIAYGTNYDMYLYDITGATKVMVGNATALTANGQIGMFAVIDNIANLPADKTWGSSDPYAPFNSLFSQKLALISGAWSGSFILKTDDEQITVPSTPAGINVLMVFTYKSNGKPNVKIIE